MSSATCIAVSSSSLCTPALKWSEMTLMGLVPSTINVLGDTR